MPPFPRFTSGIAVIFALLASGALAAITPNTTLTNDQLATRFLAQATFGPSPDSLTELKNLSYDYNVWINLEVAKPTSSAVALLTAAKTAGLITDPDKGYNRRARSEVMISGSDQLRQRVAYALSQILVISDVEDAINGALDGSSSYYDMLARDAFANYRTILMDVTRHPMMGRYLSHYKNRKANTTSGTRPDENYAREVIQLFSVGLYMLNQDGSVKTDGTGRPIETYTNDDITEFARVFTGFTDESTNNTGTGSGANDFPSAAANYTAPMRMWEKQHDVAAKKLLSYTGATKPNLPAAQAGLTDVQDAINNLVEHPSTAPFISRLLIQRLVTSNPSPAYISRVAAVFINNGSNVRGDMLAVVKAILLDTEARSTASISDPDFGKLNEPFLRLTHVLRSFKYTITAGTLPYDVGFNFTEGTMGQFPLGSPSVFNFYSPDYVPPGPIATAGLVGPEYQILNSVFSVTFPNGLYNLVVNNNVTQFKLDLSAQEALGATPTQLVDNVDLWLTHGTMSATTKATIVAAVQKITSSIVSASTVNLTRARMAVFLTVLSPDFAVIK